MNRKAILVTGIVLILVSLSESGTAKETKTVPILEKLQSVLFSEMVDALAKNDQARFKEAAEHLDRISFGVTKSVQTASEKSVTLSKRLPVDVISVPKKSASRTDSLGNSIEHGGEEEQNETEDEIKDSPVDQSNFYYTLGATSLSPFLLRRLTAEEIGSLPEFPPSNIPPEILNGNTTEFVLEDNDSISTYLEVGYQDRWAWRIDERPVCIPALAFSDKGEEAANKGTLESDAELSRLHENHSKRSGFRKGALTTLREIGKLATCGDFAFKVGFAFGEDDPSASALLGSGDVALSIQYGIPIFTYQSKRARQSINFESLFEISTNRKFQDISDRRGFGASYNVGLKGKPIPLGKSTDERLYQFSVSYLRGRIDSPMLVELPGVGAISLEGETLPLVISSNGTPVFSSSGNTFQYGFDFRLPYGERGFFTLGGTFVSGSVDPNPWVVQFGITQSGPDFLKFFD